MWSIFCFRFKWVEYQKMLSALQKYKHGIFPPNVLQKINEKIVKNNKTKFNLFLALLLLPYDRWNLVGDIPVRCLKYFPNDD